MLHSSTMARFLRYHPKEYPNLVAFYDKRGERGTQTYRTPTGRIWKIVVINQIFLECFDACPYDTISSTKNNNVCYSNINGCVIIIFFVPCDCKI